MANPVLSKPDAFTRSAEYQQNAYQQGPYSQGMYGQDATDQYGQPVPGYAAPVSSRMTMDDVIAKTSITMLLLVAAAAVTFALVPIEMLTPVVIVSAIVSLVTVLLVSFRREIPVAGVLAYAVFEGVLVGAFSKLFEFLYPGIVVQAVLGTFVAAGATLAAYKFFNIRVTPKFQRVVFIATAAFAGAMIINFVLALLGVNLGLRNIGSGAGWLAIGVSLLAVALAVFNLIVDFDFIERGVQQGAPAKESWRAAFGITITMVWLYIEILRILSYFRD